MRSLPGTTRVALANLALRMRRARTQAASMIELYGTESIAAQRAIAEQLATWNDYIAVRDAVFMEAEGRRGTLRNARQFLQVAIASDKLRTRIHKTRLALQAA